MFLSFLPLSLELLSGTSIIMSFPTLCLWNNPKLAFCLFGMGLSTHIVLKWLFSEITIVTKDDDNQDQHM